MSSISGIGSSLSNSYERLSSGLRINSAADDPAGLTIVEKDSAQATGLKVGANNMATAKDALNIADGALGSVNDYLQRIRELAIGASNTATVSESDRAAMQAEVNQLMQGISDVAKNTNYNTKPLLDGSNESFGIATDANGSQMEVSTADVTLVALGIQGFDLTKDFDISVIDDAIAKVSESRSSMGAQSNALEHAIKYNNSAAQYVEAAKSRTEDLDFAEAITEQKKEEALLQYTILMQKKKAEEQQNSAKKMFDYLT